MKKLNKKVYFESETIEAYCSCNTACSCSDFTCLRYLCPTNDIQYDNWRGEVDSLNSAMNK